MTKKADPPDTPPPAADAPPPAEPTASTPVPATERVAAPERVRMNLMVSKATHLRIKVWCVQRGVTMQSALEKMLDQAFEKVQVP